MKAQPEGTAAQAVEQALAAVERWNPVVNAMITVSAQAARERAAMLDRLAANGQSAGPLHGWVINLKDCLEIGRAHV